MDNIRNFNFDDYSFYLDFRPGTHIDDAIKLAVVAKVLGGSKVSGFVFNGMVISVSDDDSVDSVQKKWNKAVNV